MSDSTPAFQFYPGDWKRDPALRSVSLAARAFWIELLCAMHDASPRGYLRHPSGRAYKIEELARMAGCSTEEATSAMKELDEAGVPSRQADGTIYCDHLLRDEAMRQERRAAGSKGGSKRASKAQANEVANDETKGEQTTKPSSSLKARALKDHLALGASTAREADAPPQQQADDQGFGSKSDQTPTPVAANGAAVLAALPASSLGAGEQPAGESTAPQIARNRVEPDAADVNAVRDHRRPPSGIEPRLWVGCCQIADAIELHGAPGDVHEPGTVKRALGLALELEQIGERATTAEVLVAVKSARGATLLGDDTAKEILFGLRNWPDGALRDLTAPGQPSRIEALLHWLVARRVDARRSTPRNETRGPRQRSGAAMLGTAVAGVLASVEPGANP